MRAQYFLYRHQWQCGDLLEKVNMEDMICLDKCTRIQWWSENWFYMQILKMYFGWFKCYKYWINQLLSKINTIFKRTNLSSIWTLLNAEVTRNVWTRFYQRYIINHNIFNRLLIYLSIQIWFKKYLIFFDDLPCWLVYSMNFFMSNKDKLKANNICLNILWK